MPYKEDNGNITKAPQTVMVRQGQTAVAVISKPGTAPAAAPAAAATQTSGSNLFITSAAGWKEVEDSASTADFTIRREQIDGQQRDVLTIEIKLASGDARWAGIQTFDPGVVNDLRKANGIRFKVLGDGKSWSVQFPTTQTSTDHAHYRSSISTRNKRVTDVDINFSKLRQPEWGKKVAFNKNSILGIQIDRNNNLGGSGSSTIKIFDFVIY